MYIKGARYFGHSAQRGKLRRVAVSISGNGQFSDGTAPDAGSTAVPVNVKHSVVPRCYRYFCLYMIYIIYVTGFNVNSLTTTGGCVRVIARKRDFVWYVTLAHRLAWCFADCLVYYGSYQEIT